MAARKPRKTASAARIRVHTDEYGRKVYSIVGTKKFAYTLAKAKEIASKTKKRKSSSKSSTAMTVSSRKPAKRPAKRGGAKRNAKGQFVKAGRRVATRRNALKSPRAGLVRTRAARTAKLDERSARLIQSDAMYDIHSSLYTKGLKPRKGRSVGEAEGKREAVRIAEAYIADQGVEGMLYREDVGNSVIFRGKEGSGLGGMIEVYPINDDEVIAKYAEMKFTALARRNRR